jgi:hypothetical protein
MACVVDHLVVVLPKKCPNPWQETPSAMFGYNQKTQRGDPSPSMSGGYQASDMENNHDS